MPQIAKVKLVHRKTGKKLNIDLATYQNNIAAYRDYKLVAVKDPGNDDATVRAVQQALAHDKALEAAAADHDGENAQRDRSMGPGQEVKTDKPPAPGPGPAPSEPNPQEDSKPDPDAITSLGIDDRFVKALAATNIERIADLTSMTEVQLLGLDGIGAAAVDAIKTLLAARSLTLKQE
jgi:DNA-directed RNA polymerase alpha subunit